ncbi:MAG: DNA helicase RecQ [Cytophagales bacterium]|nr:DNA helicase RecQ [Cytophagales bacterium]
MDVLKEKLKEIFGYNQFRGNQEAIIRNILDKKNTFVIMPTGAGKSMCYQLPAIVQEGTAIVISPLIALMKNQVDQLSTFGISALFLNSTLTKAEMNRVKKEVVEGRCKLLYVAPESLTKEENLLFLEKAKICFVAIDEAHCISEWGHDFRPEYRKIKSIIGRIGDLPIIALTATATPKVQIDIQRNLQMEDAHIFKASFNRENLYYEVRPKKQAKRQLIRFLNDHRGKYGIVYCLSRKKVEEIAEFLKVNGYKAAPYHAGMEAAVRMKNQDAFLNEDVDIIVATIAFGMGIDKPDVRFVVHYDTPKSLEGYYQETGRAGRDGLDAHCLMFYSPNDILKLDKFNKDKPVTERDNSRLLLDEVAAYAESAACRRRHLLHYFGEEYQDTECREKEMCDNCKHPPETYEAQEVLSIVIKATLKTQERFNIEHLAKLIVGADDDTIRSWEHDKLDIFGIGKDETLEFWKSAVRQATLYDFLFKDIENIGTLKVSEKGRSFVKDPFNIKFSRPHNYDDLGEEEEFDREVPQAKAYDEGLFEMLKALRKKVAKEKGLQPWMIFQEPSLEEMATTFPTTANELAQVIGVGMGKVQKFGMPFLAAIKKYTEDNDVDSDTQVVIKSAVNKSKIKIFIIQQVDRKVDLDEIAEAKDISFDELLQEMEHICYSGTKLNLDYYIDQVMDEEKHDEIWQYFEQAETDSLQVALKELGEDFAEDEVRLIRLKFLSEVAN